MPFVKGQSGNPRGRAKSDFTLAEKARKHTDAALNVLIEIVSTPDHPQRVAAAKELLDRGWGKAPAVLSGPQGEGPAQMVIRLQTPLSEIQK